MLAIPFYENSGPVTWAFQGLRAGNPGVLSSAPHPSSNTVVNLRLMSMLTVQRPPMMRRCIVVPGFVDMHAHITGGGGEAGPASRCPESRLSAFMDAGITTVVGICGTDTVTRSQVDSKVPGVLPYTTCL